MFQQYHELKAGNPDAILFFRMGDFYEVFFEDARIASKVLDIALTSRNRNDPNPIPMAGVPHHAATAYVQKLTDRGYRVAIAEQVEDPALAKGLVKRAVTKVVSPGIALDSTYLEAGTGNYILSVIHERGEWGLAFFDVSTGDLKVTQVSELATALAEMARLQPAEALLCPVAGEVVSLTTTIHASHVMLSEIEVEAWLPEEAERELRQTLRVGDLTGFDLVDFPLGMRAAGAVVRYGRTRSGGTLTHLHDIRTYRTHQFMVLDETTRRNLEITKTMLEGKRRGSLIGLLDQTATAMGSRLLREWLSFPLLELGEIYRRQEAVASMIALDTGRITFTNRLREVADIERITSRITQGLSGSRDLSGLRRSLAALPDALAGLAGAVGLADWIPDDLCADLLADLEASLVDEPPTSLTEGGLFKEGNSDELDGLITLTVEGVRLISGLERAEKELTGISSLKIRRNRMFGYYIEVTRAQLHKVPDRYLRKQTLTTAERYITVELKELEDRVLGADERRKSLEYAMFCDLRERLTGHSERLGRLARQLAGLDTVANLAEMACRWRWCRPTVNGSLVTRIEQGRHPVVESLLTEERFVPNDALLVHGDRQLVILTGPNMSGKSTIMRQVALITLLAQIGSFVPALRAELGLCDRIFTRVGAADNLSQGQSTFMVEMAETAAILNHATQRSLVVLDEIGRGTSTYDGLSIAWAVAEDIARRIQCRGFFATHYHELSKLEETCDGVCNQSVAVAEKDGAIVFLRTLREGGASRSYGVQCAKLAGLPEPVIAHAHELLAEFERKAARDEHDQLSLFGSHGSRTPPPAPPDPLREALSTTDLDEISPRQALDLLYRLKAGL